MIKTVNLTTAVTAVDVTGKQNVIVKNIGNNTAYVSASPDIAIGADDCLSVKAGEIITLEGVATLKKVGGQYGVHGTVYALASGATTIELIPTNSVNFKPAAVDFSGEISDISALIPAAANAGNQLTDKAYVDSELSEKVDKVSGMGLSSNDYTTAEKEKLANLENYTLPTASADVLGGVRIGEGLSITDGVLSASGGGLGNLKIAYGVAPGGTSFVTIDYSSAGFSETPAVFLTPVSGNNSDVTSHCRNASSTEATFKISTYYGGLNYWLAIGV